MTKDSNIQTVVETNEMASRLETVQGSKAAEGLVSAQRRKWAKLGLGAPIVATLVSRPVLAANCLSNMMSGNLSNPNRGHCSKGWSPGGWGQPQGTINGYKDSVAWSIAGINPNALLSTLPSALIKESFPAATTIIQSLNVPYSTTLTRHFVTAYLNAALSDNDNTFMYILTKQQVLAMAMGTILIPLNAPGYPSNYKTFFDSTWV